MIQNISSPIIQGKEQVFLFGSTPIEYTLKQGFQIKSIKIMVDLEHGVEVMAPMNLANGQLDNILRKKAPWVLEKLSQFEQINPPPTTKEFISGEKFLYLGRRHTLIVKEQTNHTPLVTMQKNQFLATVRPNLSVQERRESVRSALKQWYINRAEIKLPERVAAYVPILETSPDKVQVVEMQKRWGSCTPIGTVRLDWRLIMAPIRIIDYLAVHELCHLQVSNHSPQFWKLVSIILPDYNERREWLRINGPLLRL